MDERNGLIFRSHLEKALSFFAADGISRPRHLHGDRISSLPDGVLLIILSMLPLKEMVKTSILSSRWLNLWVNTSVLDFHVPRSLDFVTNDERDKYVMWVNHVLQRHEGSRLKEFKIRFYLNIDYQKEIDRWLEFALARKVEILKLNFLLRGVLVLNSTYNYVFPDCFHSESDKANLKWLKSLALYNVDVTDETINSLLLNCPLLERLELVGNRKLFKLVISDPNLVLKYLVIEDCFGLSVFSISSFNLVSLSISSVRDITLGDLPMLVELSIKRYSYNFNYSFSQAASFLPQLESLTLTTDKIKDVMELSNLTKLAKLKRLVISVSGCEDESLTMLLYIVISCHHLEEFVLEPACDTMCHVGRLSSSSSSSFKSKSLKVFEYRGYCYRVGDDELITRVVECAPGLEKIIVVTLIEQLRYTPNSGVGTSELEEARISALKRIECLRESKCIPPHVNVHVR